MFPDEKSMPVPPTERLRVASDPKTPASLLAGMVRDPDRKVREALASNPSTSSRTLVALMWEPSLRPVAASNPSLRVKHAWWVWRDHPDSRVHLAANPGLPVEFHKELALSASTWKVYADAAHAPPGVLNRIVDSPQGYELVPTVAANPNCPVVTLRRLAGSDRAEVALGVARNPATPPDVLEWLVGHPDRRVVKAVRDNPNADDHVVAAAAFLNL